MPHRALKARENAQEGADTKKTLILKAVKYSVLAVLSVGLCYLLYGTIGSFYIWARQPLFVAVGMPQTTSRSIGFAVVGGVFAGVFVLLLALTFLYVWFIFIRPRIRKRKASDAASSDAKGDDLT
jgi:hypothetical protein